MDHAIFGMLINTFFRLKPIIVLERKLGRPRIWNGGTTPYVSGLGETLDRHDLFPASDEYHHLVTEWFILQYNCNLTDQCLMSASGAHNLLAVLPLRDALSIAGEQCAPEADMRHLSVKLQLY
jgi:hypothetical protein